MKVSSVNNNPHAACQNRPQNFGALLFTPQGERALLKLGEGGLPGSLQDIVGRAIFEGKIDRALGEELLALQKGGVLVLNGAESDTFATQLATDANQARKTIQELMAHPYRFDVKRVFGLKEGQTLRELLRERLFPTRPIVRNKPIASKMTEPIDIRINGTSRPIMIVDGGEPLSIDSRYLDLEGELDKTRTGYLKLAHQGGIANPEWSFGKPTMLTHGLPVEKLEKGNFKAPHPNSDEFPPEATVRDIHPLFVDAN